MSAQIQFNGEQLLRRKVVLEKTGLKASNLFTLIRQGDFPKPVKLSPATSAWVNSEVEAWIRRRIAQRDRSLAGVRNEASA
jgi:prophage regulatory protein